MTGDSGSGAPHGAPLPLVEDLYGRHRQALYAFLWSRLSDREEALDLVQEVFVRAWRNEARLAALPPAQQAFWLFACARRLAIDAYRHRAVVRGRAASASDAPAPPIPDPAAALERAETVRLLDRTIRALPEPLREVLALTVLGELTSAEIGSVLGLPAGTVRYRLMQARRLLRHALDASAVAGGGDG